MSEPEFNLVEEIRLRLDQPANFIAVDDSDYTGAQARAVVALFETAEPAADSKLRTIDLPKELVDGAGYLRADAETHLSRGDQLVANRLGFLANVIEDVSHLIVEPAHVVSVLMHDRDQWQTLERQAEEQLAVTEAALAVSQKSNVALAEGQSKLIGLLERVARHFESNQWRCEEGAGVGGTETMYQLIFPNGRAVALLRSETFVKTAMEEHNAAPDFITDIHAVLSQVTAIETDAAGRLSVAAQPDTVSADRFICSRDGCGKPTDRAGTLCDDCIPF